MQAGKYKNTMDCVQKIFREEGLLLSSNCVSTDFPVGFLAFFRGLEATIWRHAIWNGGYFGVIKYRIMLLNNVLFCRTVKDVLPDAETKQGVLMKNFVAGTIGGTFGTILNVYITLSNLYSVLTIS